MLSCFVPLSRVSFATRVSPLPVSSSAEYPPPSATTPSFLSAGSTTPNCSPSLNLFGPHEETHGELPEVFGIPRPSKTRHSSSCAHSTFLSTECNAWTATGKQLSLCFDVAEPSRLNLFRSHVVSPPRLSDQPRARRAH